jgi:hypothetical protein
MKRILIFTLILSSLLLASCATAATPTTGDTYTSANLPTDYENAMPVRNQLAIGTMKLDGTDNAVSAEQAQKLLPLYQALRGTSTSGGASQEEITALLTQIEGALNAEQISAIREMKLTFADMQTWATENGITLSTNGGVPGSGMGLSPEAKATKQAAEGMTGKTPGSGGGAAVMDAIIKYLEKMAQ